MVLDDQSLAELNESIAAHFTWAREHGVELPDDPTKLTALDAMIAITEGQQGISLDDALLPLAVVANLVRLCALRTAAVGPAQFRADAEKRWRAKVKSASATERRQTRADAAAVATVHDDSAVLTLERGAKELRKRVNSMGTAIVGYRKWLKGRGATLKKAGYGNVSLLSAERHLLAASWVEFQLANMVFDLDWFVAEARGTAATDPIGHLGPADDKAWHRVRSECLLHLKNSGGTAKVQLALFPSKDADPAREKKRNEGRISRAKKRTQSKT